MCGQFTTEQFGIGTCDDNVHFLSQHTIDEQMPSQDILYLIEEKNVKRDILHKNIASEYDILQEITFQNAIFYIIKPQF